MERKREERIAKHEAALKQLTDNAAKSLEATLSSANELGKQLDLVMLLLDA